MNYSMESNKKTIVISPLPGFRSVENNIYLGPWAYPGKIKNWENCENLVPPHWRDIKEIEQAIAYTEQIHEQLFPVLVQFLNSVHNTKYSLRFWKIFIGRFVHYYINFLYDRYVCLQRAVARYPNARIKVMDPACYETPVMLNDFKTKAMDDDFLNAQLFSQIAEYKCIERDLVSYNGNTQETHNSKHLAIENRSSHPPVFYRLGKRISQYGVRYTVQTAWLGLLKRLQKIVMQREKESSILLLNTMFPVGNMLQLFFSSRFKVNQTSSMEYFPDVSNLDENIRKEFERMQGADEFSTFVLQSLRYNFPYAYLEGFTEIKNLLDDKIPGKQKPQAIVCGFSPGFALTELWLAECVENGTILFGVQHGGGYGEFKYDSREHHEKKISDKYITWGWRDSEKDVPLPAPKLMDLPEKNTLPVQDQILWVGTEARNYHHMPWNALYYPTKYEYFQRQMEFLGNLSDEVQRKLLIRLNMRCSNDLISYWKDEYPDLKYDDNSRDFISRVKESSLTLCDHIGGTTFLEALSMNRPVIVVSLLPEILLRDTARTYYEMLADAGIFFDDQNAAAQYINEIQYSVDEWWHELNRQKAIQIYSERFLLKRKDDVRVWKEYLCNI